MLTKYSGRMQLILLPRIDTLSMGIGRAGGIVDAGVGGADEDAGVGAITGVFVATL